jgi:hypothetical protein
LIDPPSSRIRSPAVVILPETVNVFPRMVAPTACSVEEPDIKALLFIPAAVTELLAAMVLLKLAAPA